MNVAPPIEEVAERQQRWRDSLQVFMSQYIPPGLPVPITVGWAADQFIEQHGTNVLNVPTAGGWHIFDGVRFARDETNTIGNLAIQTTRRLLKLAIDEPDTDRRNAMFRMACKLDSASGYTLLVNTAAARPGITVGSSGLDSDRWLLNVANGTLDLRTGALRRHSRADRITKLAPVKFIADAEASRFSRFLHEVFSGDVTLIAFMQRLLGHCLTGDISEHVLPILYGNGRNGKNTLIDCFTGMLGDYAAPAPPNLLTTQRSDQHPTELADLDGRRLVFASETEEGRHLRVQLVKQITGDKFIKGRLMRQDFYTFTRTHKTLMLTNNRPRIGEQSDAIWRRVLLVPFKVSFAGKEDKKLEATLHEEWPGILNWAIRGCLDWQRSGLQIPEAIHVATEEYRGCEDVLTPFLEECCVTGPELKPDDNLKVSRAAIWLAYQEWAKRSGERGTDRNGLYGRLRQHGFEDCQMREHDDKDSKSGKARGFKGLGLLKKQDEKGPGSPKEKDSNGTGGTPGTENTGLFSRRNEVQNKRLNDVPACSTQSAVQVPEGWTIDGWCAQLLKQADSCESVNPEQAAEYRRQAEQLAVVFP